MMDNKIECIETNLEMIMGNDLESSEDHFVRGLVLMILAISNMFMVNSLPSGGLLVLLFGSFVGIFSMFAVIFFCIWLSELVSDWRL